MANNDGRDITFYVGSNGKRILKTHTRGDKRFSPFCCYVSAFGVVDSIENHYQKAKVFEDNRIVFSWKDAKLYQSEGFKQTHWAIGVKSNLLILPIVYKTPNNSKSSFALNDWGVQYYIALWYKFLKQPQNQHLIDIAKQFDGFEDIFKGNFPFSQAEVFRTVTKSKIGVEELKVLCSPLLNLLIQR